MMRTLIKSELLELLSEYPDDTRIELTMTDVDLEECKKNGNAYAGSSDVPDLYCFGLSSDLSSDLSKKVIAIQVWSNNV